MGRIRKKIGIGLALLLGLVAAASLVLLPETGLWPAGDGMPETGGGRGMQWVLWGVLTAGFGAGFWLWMRRSVLLPLERTADAVREMAAGRLNASVPQDAPDEIVLLGDRKDEQKVSDMTK